ncbi:MAG: sigma-70 family RNA polymerase sigma factor [Bacteroidota bacterium]
MTDQELWLQLQQSSKSALEQIYQEHVTHLLQYGYRFSSDQVLIEDAIHDLFIDIWRNRKGLSATTAIRPYLLVSLRRRIIKRLQKIQKFETDQEPQEVHFASEMAIDEIIAARETSEAQAKEIERAFQNLSKRQREALYLKFYEEMSYEEICETMNINYQSARNLVFNAIKTLRKYMVSVWFPLLFLLQLITK